MQSAYDWLIRIDEQLAAAEMRIAKHKRRMRELQRQGVDITQSLELDRQMGELIRILHTRRIAIVERLAKQQWTNQRAQKDKVPLGDVEAAVLTEIYRARRETKNRIFNHLSKVMQRLREAQTEGKTGLEMREVEREVVSAVTHAAKAFEQRLTTQEIELARQRLAPSTSAPSERPAEAEEPGSNVILFNPRKSSPGGRKVSGKPWPAA